MKQTFLLLSLLIGTSACNKVDNKKINVETSGRYLYRDRYGVVHDERDCPKMLNCDEKYGIWLFVKKGEVKEWRHHLEYFCNVCISDEDFELYFK